MCFMHTCRDRQVPPMIFCPVVATPLCNLLLLRAAGTVTCFYPMEEGKDDGKSCPESRYIFKSPF